MSVTLDASLLKKFPLLKPYSKDELGAMSPDQLTKLIQEINNASDFVKTSAIQLSVEKDAAQKRLEEIQAKVKSEYGVDTLEQLQAIRDDYLGKLSVAFATLEQQ